jgi:hypothetical protein
MSGPCGGPPARMISRRWFQFSLRSLLLLITAFAIWLGWEVETVRREKEALKAIEVMGGEVMALDPAKGIPRYALFNQQAVRLEDGSVIWPPGYEGGLLGYGPQLTLTDDGMKHIGRLTDIEFLSLNGVPITDAGLRRIHQLKHLQKIHIVGTAITDAGIAELKKALPACDILYTPYDGITRRQNQFRTQ